MDLSMRSSVVLRSDIDTLTRPFLFGVINYFHDRLRKSLVGQIKDTIFTRFDIL